MPRSNVRDIESLAALRLGLIRYADLSSGVLEELRATVRRAEEEFVQRRPAQWRAHVRLAERRLNEAREVLTQKRAATRAGDRPPATEAAVRVARAERRLRYCQDQEQLARSLAIELSHRCDKLLGPITEVAMRCEVDLPRAATELQRLIEPLRDYAERPSPDEKHDS